MKTYTIENTTSGHVIGDFDGETREHAIAAMLRDAGYRADVVDGDVQTDCPNWNGGNDLAATECESSEIIAIAHRDIVDGTTVTTAYNDIAPVYGESRAYAALDADDREWWDATLTRMHAVAVAAARFPAKARDRIIHAGSDGDLEAAISAQERALAEETERLAAVSYEIVSAKPNGHVGERILFSTRERADDELVRLAAAFGCDESDLRIVERAEAPDAGF